MKINKRFIVVFILVVGIIALIIAMLTTKNGEYRIDNSILVQEAKLSNDTLEKNYNMSYKNNLNKIENLPIIRTNNSIINNSLTASDEESLITMETTKSYFTEAGTNKVKINIKIDYVEGVEIKALKWAVGDQDYDYMKQNGTTLIYNTSGNSISSFFDIDKTGQYTVYVQYQKDNKIYGARKILTINNLVDPESEYPKISITRDSENGRKITINATNSTSKITELKIIKLSNKDEEVDFSTQGTSIPIQSSNNVNVTYTVSEDGFYRIYAKAESGSYSTLTTVLVKDSAIMTNIERDAENGRKITITSVSSIDDIDTMKIAKASDVTSDDYFETKGTSISITPGRTVTATYTVPEDGTYIIYVKDKAGCSLRTQVILYQDKYPINVTVEQDDTNDKLLHISASCSTEVIKEMKIASGRYQTDYFETGGTKLNITQGNNVKIDYTINESGYYTIYAATDNMKYTYTIGINISEVVNVESVSLNKTQITMKVGDKEQLTATVNPSNATNKTISWESSAPNIATVDNSGNITAQEVGEAVITVKTADGNKTAECRVTVEPVAVTGVSLNKSETTITIGGTEKLIATVNPNNATNKDVTWESEDPSIADVDEEGNITAKQVGETVIRVRTVDGNKTAECRVTVEGEKEPEPGDTYEITVGSQLATNNTEANIIVEITGDSSKVNIIKIGKGSLNIDYFKNNGGQTLDINNNLAQIKVTENGTYTIYTEDTDGNVNLKEINITGIQKENPNDNQGNNDNDNQNNNNSNNNQNNQGNNNSNTNQNANNNNNNGYYVDKLPYTGKEESNIEYYILGVACIVILAGGIILIRKYVIK